MCNICFLDASKKYRSVTELGSCIWINVPPVWIHSLTIHYTMFLELITTYEYVC